MGKGNNNGKKNLLGGVEICPGEQKECRGTFVKTSWNRVRCDVCALEEKKERSREWNAAQRQRQGEPSYPKTKYEPHKCWRCGRETTNYALCDGCHYGGEKDKCTDNVGCIEMNRKLDKLYKKLKKELKEGVVEYSCKNMSQEELKALIPSLSVGVETPTSG
jgi:hypothetical protein